MYTIGNEEKEAVARVIDSGNLFKVNNGLRETEQCEAEMREKFGCDFAMLMTSGSGALTSALIGMGIGPGDEVIVPAYTYIATAMSVVSVGAMPVITEVNETLTLDPEDVDRKITDRTKAILPVHIQGFPCDMKALCDIAKNHGLFVLEDACQADGGSFNGKRLGTIGDAGALSFNQYKIITCGEGGALLTNDRRIFERALIYHDSNAVKFFGSQLDGITEPLFCGSEFRTNEIQAAILREQLKKLDGLLSGLRRSRNALRDALSDTFTFAPSNDLDGDCGTTLAFRFETEEAARKFATSDGIYGTLPIDTGKHVYTNWEPIMHRRGAVNPAFDPFRMEANRVPDYRPDLCPKTLDILSRTVYLGMSPWSTDEDIERRAEACRKAMS